MYRLRIFAVFALLAAIVACKRTHPKIAGAVVSGTLGSSPTMITLLGCQADTQQGTTVQCEQATPWVASPIGTPTNIWCYDFAKLDSTHLAVDVDVADVKATDATGHARYQLGWEPVLQSNGTLTDPTASGAYLAHGNVGSVMAGTVATITQVGISACLQVTCADSNGPYCVVHSSASLSRGAQPLAVTAVSPAQLNTTVTTATNVTITTTPGGATNANGCILAGYAVPGFATSQTSVTCVVPPGSYAAVSGAAAVATPANNTIAYSGGFAFSNAACTISSVAPDWAFATGSPSAAIAVIGTHFLTPTCTVAGVSATCTASTTGVCAGQTSGNCIALTAPAYSTNNGSSAAVTLTVTPVGFSACSTTGTTPDSFWYVPGGSSAPLAVGGWTAQAVTLTGSTVNTAVDQGPNSLTMSSSSTGTTWHATGGGISGQLPYFDPLGNVAFLTNTGWAGGAVSAVTWGFGVDLTSTANGALAYTGWPSSLIWSNGAGATFTEYNGANPVTFTLNTWSSLISGMAGATSDYQILNGGAASTGSSANAGFANGAQLTIGGSNSVGYPWNGFISYAILYQAVLTGTPLTNFKAFVASQ